MNRTIKGSGSIYSVGGNVVCPVTSNTYKPSRRLAGIIADRKINISDSVKVTAIGGVDSNANNDSLSAGLRTTGRSSMGSSSNIEIYDSAQVTAIGGASKGRYGIYSQNGVTIDGRGPTATVTATGDLTGIVALNKPLTAIDAEIIATGGVEAIYAKCEVNTRHNSSVTSVCSFAAQTDGSPVGKEA